MKIVEFIGGCTIVVLMVLYMETPRIIRFFVAALTASIILDYALLKAAEYSITSPALTMWSYILAGAVVVLIRPWERRSWELD